MARVILHSDLNNFYASVECLHRPEIRDLPVAVCGDPSLRHGIVLAKNQMAKKAGIITGEAIWQARQKACNLVVLPPNFQLYLRFARLARQIYAQYSEQIEPFGLDEAWIDVTGSTRLFGDGEKIANEIRQRMRDEIGLTVSVGVGDNKIFAKLGSDMKKPDATTVIKPGEYKETVWKLPASDLLYVGRSTRQKLMNYNIFTIGDLANTSITTLRALLGKWGEILWTFANGLDISPVTRMGEESLIKSIGNSTTTPRNLENDDDVLLTVYVLAESVAARMREHGFKCKTVQIYIRDNELVAFEKQGKLERPSNNAGEMVKKAMQLFRASYTWDKPIRTIGVRGTDLVTEEDNIQLSLFLDDQKRINIESLDKTVDDIRRRFGHFSVQRAMMLKDKEISSINPKGDHIIHPVNFFN